MKKPHKPILLIFLYLMLFASCTREHEVMSVLDTAESEMEDSPETALSILDSLDRSLLKSRKSAARHALLYSQALDKNYIDLTTDSIISPAVKYYSRHGSADERLKAQYYLGCIYRNARNHEKEMECYVRAEQYVDEALDYKAVGRLYSAKRKVYFDYYQFELSYEEAIKSQSYYKLSSDTDLRGKALINAALSAGLLRQYSKSDSILMLVRDSLWCEIDPNVKGEYYSVSMTIAEGKDDTALVERQLHNYLKLNNAVHLQNILWGSVVKSYLYLGNVDSAKWALDNYSIAYPQHDMSPQYLLLASMVYSKVGNFKKAYSNLNKYNEVVGAEDISKFNSDTKYVEERYEQKLSSMRQSNVVSLSVSISVSGLLAAALILLLMRYRLKRKDYELEIAGLKEKEMEENNLRIENRRKELEEINRNLEIEKVVLETMLDESSLSPEAGKIISDRLSTVVQVFANTASGQGKVDDYVRSKMDELMSDKDEFVLTTMMSYAAVHPKFVKYLKEYNLTDWEVGYCCFYAMGLRGKDIGNMLNKGGHTHHNRASIIRAKLGLKERDGHLGRFLMKKVKEIEEGESGLNEV